jgi:glycosyltransferase involved in cell wall biosynthesis
MNRVPIRVLQIVGPMNKGGIETFLMNVYRKIDREKLQFDFLVTREEKGTFDDEITSMGGKVFYIPHITKLGLYRYRKRIIEFLEDHKEYKIIHSHVIATSGIFQPIARKKGIKIRISHGHSAPNKQKPKDLINFIEIYFKKILKYYTAKNSTHYFACSYEAGEWLFGRKIADSQMTIINNGIDTLKFKYNEEDAKNVRKSLSINESSLVIGNVGNLNEVKNHKFLLDIFKAVNTILPDSILILVGEGSLRISIEEKIKKLGLNGKVKMLGSRNDVNELLKGFDVFVMPSLFEGLPVSLVEAQASTLPCIISDTITREIDLGLGLVKFVSLDRAPEYWAKIIIDNFQGNRNIPTDMLIERGFDSTTITEWLEDFYFNSITKQ